MTIHHIQMLYFEGSRSYSLRFPQQRQYCASEQPNEERLVQFLSSYVFITGQNMCSINKETPHALFGVFIVQSSRNLTPSHGIKRIGLRRKKESRPLQISPSTYTQQL